MSVINNELACLALTSCVPLNARRRSASCVVEGVKSDSTHNSTQLDVQFELCRYKRGLGMSMLVQTEDCITCGTIGWCSYKVDILNIECDTN